MRDAASPLSPEQQQELRDAKTRAGSFSSAARVAAFNGWTLGFCAVASLLCGISSPAGVVLGLGLVVVARNEFVGRRRIRALDPSGLKLLWRNQIGLMLLVVAYCAWCVYTSLAHPDPELAEVTRALGQGADTLVRSLTLTIYGAVVVATVLFQGLNALYYFVRVKRLEEYLRDTPEWVLEIQRSTIE